MKSVISRLQSKDFPRIRIGIGKSRGRDWKDFVIGKVSKQDQSIAAEATEKAAEAVECILEKGIDRAMNEYNIKPKSKGKDASDTQGND